MKSFNQVKQTALELFSMAGFVSHINNDEEYSEALALMDELIEEYDLYKSLIEVLSGSIERWEDESEEFSAFNARIEALDHGVATLLIEGEESGSAGVLDMEEIKKKARLRAAGY